MLAINRAQLATLVGPLIPDRAAVFLEPGDIGLAPQEPKKLDDDRPQVQLLGRQERKSAPEVKPHLPAEHTQRPRTCPVIAAGAGFEDITQQIQILKLWMIGCDGTGSGVQLGEGCDGVHAQRLEAVYRFAEPNSEGVESLLVDRLSPRTLRCRETPAQPRSSLDRDRHSCVETGRSG